MSSESDWQDYCQERAQRGRRARCTQLGLHYPHPIDIYMTPDLFDKDCVDYAEDFEPFRPEDFPYTLQEYRDLAWLLYTTCRETHVEFHRFVNHTTYVVRHTLTFHNNGEEFSTTSSISPDDITDMDYNEIFEQFSTEDVDYNRHYFQIMLTQLPPWSSFDPFRHLPLSPTLSISNSNSFGFSVKIYNHSITEEIISH